VTTEHYRRAGKYRKEELDDISRWLGIFVCSSKRSGAQESGLVNEYECWKRSWNTD